MTDYPAIEQAGAALQDARRQLITATEVARSVAIAAATDGVSENALHIRLGVTRRTIRKWLGKDG